MIRNIGVVLSWFALMFVALQVNRIELGHGLCGRWGCGPPVEALLSMHLFWFALIFPPAIYLSKKWLLNWRLVGAGLVALALIVMVGFFVSDYLGENRGYYEAGYVWQRYLLSLASWINVPVVQIGVLGLVLAKFGRCRCCQISTDNDNRKPLAAKT